MTTPAASKGRRALAALTEIVRGSVRPPTRARLDSGLQTLRARIDAEQAERPQAARRAFARWSMAAALTAAAVIVAVGVFRSRLPGAPALAYQIEGGSLVEGGYLRESGPAGVKLLFSEGTEFVLMSGTRGRLRAVDASGARIAIEQGTASFHVRPAPAADRRWQVDAGPFLVTVKGTVFTVSWDAETEKLDLKLRHGRVTVTGPVSGGEIALRAGQRLVIDLPQGKTVITEQKAGEWAESQDQAAPEEPHATRDRPAVKVGRPIAPAPSARLDSGHGWTQALAAGHLDRILTEAEQAGVKATLDKASSDDLLALADAARYRRRMDLARAALLAGRRRFPDSPRALDAAFLLGRVEEASDGRLPRAIEWYDEYLTRAPAGTYASEALGRKMTLTSKLEGVGGARAIAEEYLRRFPGGTYAGPARAFLRGP